MRTTKRNEHGRNGERAARQGSESGMRLQHVISGANLGYWDWDYRTNRQVVNDRWLEILGLGRDDIENHINDCIGRMHPDDREKMLALAEQAFAGKRSFRAEFRLRHKAGHWVWVEGSGSVVEWGDDGLPMRVCGIHQEISQRKRVEDSLQKSERRFRELLLNLPNVAVQGYDRDHRVTYWNTASERLYGYSAGEAMGLRLENLIIPESRREGVDSAIENWINLGEKIPNEELVLKHKDGRPVPVFSSHVMLGQGTDHPEMFCIDVDPAERNEAMLELERLATNDPLTQLTNRNLLYEELNHRLKEADRFGYELAVFFIDLDNFKIINDGHGHHFGDAVLRQVAERLSGTMREYDTVARFGGDEFVLVMSHVEDGDEVASVAEKVLGLFRSPLKIDGQDIFVGASIGVSLFPADGRDSRTLLKHADAAMYEAKKAGRNQFHFYTPELNREIERHVAIASGLRHAVNREAFRLVYQPQVALGSGRIVSCEALLRWDHPDGKPGRPDEFIPIAEKFGLIDDMTRWVLRQVNRDRAGWTDAGMTVPPIFVNVSGGQARLQAFYDAFQDSLRAHALQPGDIGIELTENTLIKGSDSAVGILHKLRGEGVRVALDDFGTGYSSLSYLKRFPIDIIKIDQSFVKDGASDRDDGSIVRAIIAISASLGLKVIAEGVETEAQRRFVLEAGCDVAQGFHFHVPLDAQEMSRLLNINNPA
ncbi:MAG: EAL domain-containing protein [Pseudomonadota bacterium]|nr:EAL domain-containing protein [Pseudomonadota bacterium]